jgi:hypothetical protein
MKADEGRLLSRAEKRKKARRRKRGPYRKSWSPKPEA